MTSESYTAPLQSIDAIEPRRLVDLDFDGDVLPTENGGSERPLNCTATLSEHAPPVRDAEF